MPRHNKTQEPTLESLQAHAFRLIRRQAEVQQAMSAQLQALQSEINQVTQQILEMERLEDFPVPPSS